LPQVLNASESKNPDNPLIIEIFLNLVVMGTTEVELYPFAFYRLFAALPKQLPPELPRSDRGCTEISMEDFVTRRPVLDAVKPRRNFSYKLRSFFADPRTKLKLCIHYFELASKAPGALQHHLNVCPERPHQHAHYLFRSIYSTPPVATTVANDAGFFEPIDSVTCCLHPHLEFGCHRFDGQKRHFQQQGERTLGRSTATELPAAPPCFRQVVMRA
jgi:hypothetical protein